MPQTYDKMGLNFLYPDNWQIDEQETLKEHSQISVYMPNGGFWYVRLHSSEEDPKLLAEQVVSVMREEYDSLEVIDIKQKIGDYELLGYEMNFYCLDLTNTAVVLVLRDDERTLLIHYQAEDKEFEQNRQVFLAITTSLLSA